MREMVDIHLPAHLQKALDEMVPMGSSPVRRKFSKEEDYFILEMRERGASWRSIARALDCCKDTASQRGRELELARD